MEGRDWCACSAARLSGCLDHLQCLRPGYLVCSRGHSTHCSVSSLTGPPERVHRIFNAGGHWQVAAGPSQCAVLSRPRRARPIGRQLSGPRIRAIGAILPYHVYHDRPAESPSSRWRKFIGRNLDWITPQQRPRPCALSLELTANVVIVALLLFLFPPLSHSFSFSSSRCLLVFLLMSLSTSLSFSSLALSCLYRFFPPFFPSFLSFFSFGILYKTILSLLFLWHMPLCFFVMYLILAENVYFHAKICAMTLVIVLPIRKITRNDFRSD